MKQWFSASELAGLPGLPGTIQGVNKAAKREGWNSRKRQARGGGFEYSADSLPPETKQHLAIAAMNEEMKAYALPEGIRTEIEKENEEIKAEAEARRLRKQANLAKYTGLRRDDPKRQRAEARRWLIEASWNYRRSHQCGIGAAREGFVEAFLRGDISAPDWVFEMVPVHNHKKSLCVSTLYNWERAYDREGTWGLTDGYGNRKRQSIIETCDTLKRAVLGLLLDKPHITGTKIRQYLEATEADMVIVKIPSVRAIERYIATWKEENKQVWCYMTNPDQWKNIYMAAAGSHFEGIERLNQLWEMDSTPADFMLRDGRHSVVGNIDMYSRRVKFLVSKSSKATAVCAVLRAAILVWGKCEEVRTDNGADYVSNHVTGALRDLEIKHQICIPFESEGKGTIERLMKTLNHGLLDLLPGFIGHNVGERKAIEARKSFSQRLNTPGEIIDVELSSTELQERIDKWADHIYGNNPHAGLNGKTPNQIAAEWDQPVKIIENERALDALLSEVAGTKTITKKGIRHNNQLFIHPALYELSGEQVTIKLDDAALGKLAVYDMQCEFVCVAECPDLTGISRQEWAVASKKGQKKFMAAQAAEYREYKKSISKDPFQTIMDHRIEEAPNITQMPASTESFTTPALDEAAKAVSAGANATKETTAEVIELPVDRVIDLKNPTPEDLSVMSAYQRWDFWRHLLSKENAGQPLKDFERRFFEKFRESPLWRGFKVVHDDLAIITDEDENDEK
jgi:transposase InsO family protein